MRELAASFGFTAATPGQAVAAAVQAGATGFLDELANRVALGVASVCVVLDPGLIGNALASEPDVIEVHDLHVWEVTSGFPALSAHVVVRGGADCHERRRHLQRVLEERFGIRHTTLQVDHEVAPQGPLQIEVAPTHRQ